VKEWTPETTRSIDVACLSELLKDFGKIKIVGVRPCKVLDFFHILACCEHAGGAVSWTFALHVENGFPFWMSVRAGRNPADVIT
jgi:hypothetical protein